MARFIEEVSSYSLRLYANRSQRDLATASISLDVPNTVAVWLKFYPDDVPLPDNDTVEHMNGGNLYYVRYPQSSYAAVVDMLRNESPIYFSYDDESDIFEPQSGPTQTANLATRIEDVGEGE